MGKGGKAKGAAAGAHVAPDGFTFEVVGWDAQGIRNVLRDCRRPPDAFKKAAWRVLVTAATAIARWTKWHEDDVALVFKMEPDFDAHVGTVYLVQIGWRYIVRAAIADVST